MERHVVRVGRRASWSDCLVCVVRRTIEKIVLHTWDAIWNIRTILEMNGLPWWSTGHFDRYVYDVITKDVKTKTVVAKRMMESFMGIQSWTMLRVLTYGSRTTWRQSSRLFQKRCNTSFIPLSTFSFPVECSFCRRGMFLVLSANFGKIPGRCELLSWYLSIGYMPCKQSIINQYCRTLSIQYTSGPCDDVSTVTFDSLGSTPVAQLVRTVIKRPAAQ